MYGWLRLSLARACAVQLAFEQSLETKLADISLRVTTKADVEKLLEGNRHGLEPARYFDPLFIDDYWYLIERPPEIILEWAVRTGEAAEFRAVGFDSSAEPHL